MMNILSHCVTDRRSMTAAIKHCQKHNISKLVVRSEAFRKWWFDGEGDDDTYAWPDAPFKHWVHRHITQYGKDWTWLELEIWPADMNPKGF